ncbi:MAG: hypothetical protein KA369_08380 [Spirochaetes bacterium]|nr:hypothetical protein [Spirochaetota bacterium]
MNQLKSYLQAGTKDSMMRLGFFVIIINSSVVCFTVCFLAVYTMVTTGNFKDVAELIKAFAFFVAGLLGPVSIGKGVQSFGERPYYSNGNSPFGEQP